MTKQSFEEKKELVKNGILNQLKEEGVDIKDINMEQIESITKGYMLVVQCIWYRLTDDKKIAKLLSSFEDTIPQVLG